MNPTILNIMMDETVNEGDELSFNVQYQDVHVQTVFELQKLTETKKAGFFHQKMVK